MVLSVGTDQALRLNPQKLRWDPLLQTLCEDLRLPLSPDTVTKQTARLRCLIVSPKGERRPSHTLAKRNAFFLQQHHHILSTLLLYHFKGG